MSARGLAVWFVSFTVGIVLLVGLAGVAYGLLDPGPMDFAGGRGASASKSRTRDPTGVPPSLSRASLVERGEYLARAADCVDCHTAESGTPFAGGRAIVLPFGTLYSTNITPDPDTGIGKYTDDDFLNAIHKGLRRDSKNLYPAMPYASYTYMSDGDALAIKAYLFSLKPLHSVLPPNTLSFPFNQRPLVAIWNAFFNPNHRYQPNPERSDEWNRGAYLAEAMEHCGECHTPRNLFLSLDNRRKFGGELQAGWRAYDISTDPQTGVGAWNDGQLVDYLSRGHSPGRGAACGPMGEAVDLSISHLDPADVAAIATYLKSVPTVHSEDLPAVRSTAAPESHAEQASGNAGARGETVYAEACAGCHGWTGVSSALPLATLIGVRSINDPSGINVAQVIVHGAERHPGETTSAMPAFGETFSDSDIASVVNYVTARFGARGANLSAIDVARLRNQN
jgi:mono/diheme cytochrome c family protein